MHDHTTPYKRLPHHKKRRGGYHLPPQRPLYRFGHLRGQAGPDLETVALGFHPDRIALDVTLRVEERPYNPQILITYKGESRPPLLLEGLATGGDPGAPCTEAVHFDYAGCGFYWDNAPEKKPLLPYHHAFLKLKGEDGAPIGPGNRIFTKPFHVFSEAEIHLEVAEGEDYTHILHPPGRPNAFPRFPCGGVLCRGLDLEAMEAQYLMIDPQPHTTEYALERHQDFCAHGLLPPQDGYINHQEICFMDPPAPPAARSVMEAIYGGDALIRVQTSPGHNQLYRSCAHETRGAWDRLTLHFIPTSPSSIGDAPSFT